MNKNAKQKPLIRVQGFDDAWEQRKLESLCIKFTDGDWIEAKDQSDSGVRLVQTGNVGVTEYLDKPNNKKWISEETFNRLHCEEVLPGDILISRLPEPAGRACIMPALETKMITAVDCTIVRTAPEINNKFLVQYLSSQSYFKEVNTCLAGGTRQRISRSNLANFDIPVPTDKAEQDAIGEFLDNLDNLITLHQRELEKIISVRKAMIERMFPQVGSNVPAVRFGQYKQPWNFCRFSQIFKERHVVDTISKEYPQLAFTIEEGVIRPEDKKTNKRDFLIIDKATKKYLRTEYNDIIYNPANVIYGAIHRNSFGKGCVSPIYKIFYTDQDPSFMECIVRNPSFIKAISRRMEGTVKKLRTLKPESFLEMGAYIAPTIDEQRQIGEFFCQLDRLIELENKELEKIKHIKTACLEKMFV